MNKKNTIGTLLAIGCGALAVYGVKQYMKNKNNDVKCENEELFNIIEKKQKVLPQAKYKKYLLKELSRLIDTANKYKQFTELLIDDIKTGDINEELYNIRFNELSKIENVTPNKDVVCQNLSKEILTAEDSVLELIKKIKGIKKEIIKAYSAENVESLVKLNNLCVDIVQADNDVKKVIEEIVLEDDIKEDFKSDKKDSNYGIIKVNMENLKK